MTAAAALLCAGCSAPPDLGPCRALTFHGTLTDVADPLGPLDVLVVLDTSPRMAPELPHARAELARIFGGLSVGDLNGDGVPDTPSPFRDVHVAVVTADLGAGLSTSVMGCTAGGGGAWLVGGASCGLAPGTASYCAPDDTAAVGDALRCLVPDVASTCPVVQPLDAALAALLPSTSPLVFVPPTAPHADLFPNDGFLRPDSFLAVLVVTNEDDCSVTRSDALMGPPGVPPAVRCAASPWLDTVERFVAALRTLRPGDPNLVALGVVAGVPRDLVAVSPASPGLDYAAILADPRMAPRPDATGAALVPACSSSRSAADPAPRLVRAAQQFGENAAVASICDDDWSAVLGVLQWKVGMALSLTCLPRVLPRDASGRVACKVAVVLPGPDMPCGPSVRTCLDPSLAPGVSSWSVGADGRWRCELAQLPVDAATLAAGTPPEGVGFYVDDYTAAARIGCGFGSTGLGVLAVSPALPGATFELSCVESVGPDTDPRCGG